MKERFEEEATFYKREMGVASPLKQSLASLNHEDRSGSGQTGGAN